MHWLHHTEISDNVEFDHVSLCMMMLKIAIVKLQINKLMLICMSKMSLQKKILPTGFDDVKSCKMLDSL